MPPKFSRKEKKVAKNNTRAELLEKAKKKKLKGVSKLTKAQLVAVLTPGNLAKARKKFNSNSRYKSAKTAARGRAADKKKTGRIASSLRAYKNNPGRTDFLGVDTKKKGKDSKKKRKGKKKSTPSASASSPPSAPPPAPGQDAPPPPSDDNSPPPPPQVVNDQTTDAGAAVTNVADRVDEAANAAEEAAAGLTYEDDPARPRSIWGDFGRPPLLSASEREAEERNDPDAGNQILLAAWNLAEETLKELPNLGPSELSVISDATKSLALRPGQRSAESIKGIIELYRGGSGTFLDAVYRVRADLLHVGTAVTRRYIASRNQHEEIMTSAFTGLTPEATRQAEVQMVQHADYIAATRAYLGDRIDITDLRRNYEGAANDVLSRIVTDTSVNNQSLGGQIISAVAGAVNGVASWMGVGGGAVEEGSPPAAVSAVSSAVDNAAVVAEEVIASVADVAAEAVVEQEEEAIDARFVEVELSGYIDTVFQREFAPVFNLLKNSDGAINAIATTRARAHNMKTEMITAVTSGRLTLDDAKARLADYITGQVQEIVDNFQRGDYNPDVPPSAPEEYEPPPSAPEEYTESDHQYYVLYHYFETRATILDGRYPNLKNTFDIPWLTELTDYLTDRNNELVEDIIPDLAEEVANGQKRLDQAKAIIDARLDTMFSTGQVMYDKIVADRAAAEEVQSASSEMYGESSEVYGEDIPEELHPPLSEIPEDIESRGSLYPQLPAPVEDTLPDPPQIIQSAVGAALSVMETAGDAVESVIGQVIPTEPRRSTRVHKPSLKAREAAEATTEIRTTRKSRRAAAKQRQKAGKN